jgi:hypothetical protein
MLWPLIGLVLTLIPMLYLNRWISRHIQGLGLLVTGRSDVAIMLYFLIMLPGILIHELSHWLAAKLLGLKTGKISLWPKKSKGNKVRLGSVGVSRADPLRESLVGLAPLIFGVGIILLVGALVFDLNAMRQAFVVGDLGWFLRLVGKSFWAPDFWLWLYLIFVLSNAMLPSESDRRAWLPLGIFLAVMAVLLIVVGWTPAIPATLTDGVIGAATYLNSAFIITLAIDLFFMALIAGLEWGLSVLLGKRINY